MKKSAAVKNSGTLYVVATPIGNYDDITLRALNALQECDVIVCEESKEALRLLKHYEIEKEIMELNEHNDTESSVECMKLLTQGKKLALISDAGTPLLADPGDILVKTAVKYKIDVKVLPGASSVLTALVRSTLNSKQFVYAGFLNRKNETRDAEIQQLAREPRTIVLMDTPYRLKTILSALAAAMPDRQAYVGCNLTMTNEAHHYGSLIELEEFFEEHKFRGEYVIVIEGSSEPFEYASEADQDSAQSEDVLKETPREQETDGVEEAPQRGRNTRKTRVVQSADYDPMDDVDGLPLPDSEDDVKAEVGVDDYEPVLAEQNQSRNAEGGEGREQGQRDRNWNNGGRRWNNNNNNYNKRRWDNNRRYNNGDRRDSGAVRTEGGEGYAPANTNGGGAPNNGNGNGYRQQGNRNNHGGRDGQRRGNYRQNRGGGQYRYNNNYRDNQRDQVPNDQFAGPNNANNNNNNQQTNTYYDESYDRRENFGNREGANYSRFDQTLNRDQFGNRGNFNRGRGGNRGNYNRGNSSGNDGNRRSDAAGFGQFNDYPPKRRKW